MDIKDFSYRLPEDLIAQQPGAQRDASRMLVMDRASGSLSDARFLDLPRYLQQGDVLVVNNSRVMPARLYGRKATGAILEILLITRREATENHDIWEVLARPGKRISEGDVIDLGHGCKATVISRLSDKKWEMCFSAPDGFDRHLEKFGRAPLPPYIKRKKGADPNSNKDRERYQTVYADRTGSIAAPTAGLHFTQDILDYLYCEGVAIAPITLHVGIGTFMPVEARRVEDHAMEPERFEISQASADLINRASRVIAVGTTSTRALETACDDEGRLQPLAGETRLYIYPGYRFKCVDALLTNFHLPESSLFLLACAFGGADFVRRAYDHAVAEKYRFYSYGDCMLMI